MTGPDVIRERIRSAATARCEAEAEKAKATARLTRALREAAASNISHSEAARLAGLSRNGAYELLRKAEQEERRAGG
jgi:hypothetical protein